MHSGKALLHDFTSLEHHLTGDNTTSLWYYLIKQIDLTFGNAAFLSAVLDQKGAPLTFLIISDTHAQEVARMLISVSYTEEQKCTVVAENLNIELIRYWLSIDALLEKARVHSTTQK